MGTNAPHRTAVDREREPPVVIHRTAGWQNDANALTMADQIEKIAHALTARELSKLLSVSQITIFRLAAAGRIPSFRIGTCVRFDPRQVANWLRSQ
jgi:excisionase family DNA binding protein